VAQIIVHDELSHAGFRGGRWGKAMLVAKVEGIGWNMLCRLYTAKEDVHGVKFHFSSRLSTPERGRPDQIRCPDSGLYNESEVYLDLSGNLIAPLRVVFSSLKSSA